MKNKLSELNFKGGEHYLVLPHINPDGDSIGSSVLLCDYLLSIGAKSYILNNDELNLSIKFLKNDKFITSEEFLNMGIVGYTAITLDSSDTTRYSDRAEIVEKAKRLINIDHHVTNTRYGDVNIIDEHASSTGEVIYRILSGSDYEISKKAAEAVYTAISTDTGSFKYSNTGEMTHEIVSELYAKGFNFTEVNTNIYQNNHMDSVKILKIALNNLKFYKDNKLGVSFVTLAQADEEEIKVYETDGICEYIRNINGVEVSIFLKEVEKDVFKANLRAKYEYDVSELALIYGGGGHKRAAGFTTEGSIEDIIKELVGKIEI
jgi:phosphoesterase RecJ-like protein